MKNIVLKLIVTLFLLFFAAESVVQAQGWRDLKVYATGRSRPRGVIGGPLRGKSYVELLSHRGITYRLGLQKNQRLKDIYSQMEKKERVIAKEFRERGKYRSEDFKKAKTKIDNLRESSNKEIEAFLSPTQRAQIKKWIERAEKVRIDFLKGDPPEEFFRRFKTIQQEITPEQIAQIRKQGPAFYEKLTKNKWSQKQQEEELKKFYSKILTKSQNSYFENGNADFLFDLYGAFSSYRRGLPKYLEGK